MKSMLKSLMSVAVAALAFTSCSTDATEEVIPNGGTKTLKVNATIDQTRTVMAENHVNLEWADGDEILLYMGENATAFNKITPKTSGKITGVTYKEGDKVYANYAIDNEKYSEGVKKAEINIKNAQKQTKANVFAGTNLPMVAKGEIKDGAVNLVFQPVGCVLVFNVYGPAENEKIKSIKFETAEKCWGYKKCDLTAGLTAEAIGYKESELEGGNKSVTVTLTEEFAPIVASKPTDTKVGENQVYMVVAPFNYTAATITVTTDANKTYSFTTASGIDCSQNTARVVNLNLKNAPEFKPEIIVSTTVPEQSSERIDDLLIEGIKFKNIATAGLDPANVVSVYSNEELTEQQDVDWLTIGENKANLFKSGELYCNLAANGDSAPRTAYIGIKCPYTDAKGEPQVAKAAIAIKQVGAGSKPAEVIKAILTVEDIAKLNLVSNAYKEFAITAADGSAWTGYSAGDDTYLQLGWNTTPSKGAAKSHVLVPNANKVIKNITFTPDGRNSKDRVLVLLPDNFTYTGQSADDVKKAAYAISANTVSGSTEPLTIDLTGKGLKRFMIRAVGGAVSLSNITIEYAE